MSASQIPLRTKFILLIFGLVVILGIGAIDYMTGTEISFAIFYLFPIVLVTWWLGFLGGFTMALAAMAVWLGAELLGGQRYSLGVEYWNATVRFCFFLIVAIGLSVRRKDDAALRKAKERFTGLFDFAPDPIILMNGEGVIIQANEQVSRVFGYPQRELVGMPAETLLAERFRSAQTGGRYIGHPKLHDVIVGEAHGRGKDGAEFPVEILLSPLERSGEREVIAVIRNAAARRRVETVQAHLAAIVESSEDAIFSQSLAGVIESWNAGAERLYGYTAKEAIGKPVTFLALPEDEHETQRMLERVRQGEQLGGQEVVRRRKDGTLIRVSLTASPMKDPTGRIIGISTIARRLPDF